MPVKIKLGLSLAVVLVAAIAAYYQHVLGHERIQYVVAFLGFFMIFAMWLFPEVKRDEFRRWRSPRHNKLDRPRPMARSSSISIGQSRRAYARYAVLSVPR